MLKIQFSVESKINTIVVTTVYNSLIWQNEAV